MRIPAKPPHFDSILKNIEKERFLSLIFQARSPTYKQRYLHWDKMRHLSAPRGLSHEEWWAMTKLARRSLYKSLPLHDRRRAPFVFCLPDPAMEYLHQIDQGAGGRLELAEGGIATSSMRDRYLVHSLMEEAITSSQLEGAVTTRAVAKEMIRTNRKPRDTSERMILNNYLAMRRIREIKPQPLTKELLLDLHRILTTDTLETTDAVGRFRLPNESVGVYDMDNNLLHDPPSAEQLEDRLARMCQFANEESETDFFIHPVVRAIILHFWLAYEHPFVDGNGRCARALFYWSMLRHGAWLTEFLSISQIIRKAPVKYGRAFLYTETDEMDLTYFIFYHLDVIKQAIEQLHQYISTKSRNLRQAEQLIRKQEGLNHRQLALLSHALRHADAEYTIQSHRTSHDVVYQTALRDLLDLRDRGLLREQKKYGKTLCYHPVQDLEQKVCATQ